MVVLRYPREIVDELFKDTPAEPVQREVLQTLVDSIFFASLMIEEHEPVRVAIVHHGEGASGLAKVTDVSPDSDDDPRLAWDVTEMVRGEFNPKTLAKLARGLEYGVQLVVVGGVTASEMWIDGIARRSERTDGGRVMRISAPRPGVLVFEWQQSEVLRFEAGERAPSTIDVLAEDGPLRVAIGKITLDPGSGEGYSFCEWAIRKLLRKMRATGSGAIFAMHPSQPDIAVLDRVRYRPVDTMRFRDRIVDDRTKRFRWILRGMGDQADHHLSTDEVRAREVKRTAADAAEDALVAAIDDLARLSAIDGALLAGPQLEIYGAGYLVQSNSTPIVVRSLDVSMKRTKEYPAQYGARHKAAFAFAHDTPGGVAFVVSEDGPVSCALRVGDQVVVWSVRVSET
jgi:hypothetical protein